MIKSFSKAKTVFVYTTKKCVINTRAAPPAHNFLHQNLRLIPFITAQSDFGVKTLTRNMKIIITQILLIVLKIPKKTLTLVIKHNVIYINKSNCAYHWYSK
jgi:hypothetical protein